MSIDRGSAHRAVRDSTVSLATSSSTNVANGAEQIEAHAAEHGLTGQAARRKSFYETRPPKQKLGVDESLQDALGRSHRQSTARRCWMSCAPKAIETGRPQPGAATSARAIRPRDAVFGTPPGRDRARGGQQSWDGCSASPCASHCRGGPSLRMSDRWSRTFTSRSRSSCSQTHQQTGDAVHHPRPDHATGTARSRTRALRASRAVAIGDASPIWRRPSGMPRSLSADAKASRPHSEAALLHHRHDQRSELLGVHGVAGAGKSTLVRRRSAKLRR
jgi:hypothetical protein